MIIFLLRASLPILSVEVDLWIGLVDLSNIGIFSINFGLGEVMFNNIYIKVSYTCFSSQTNKFALFSQGFHRMNSICYILAASNFLYFIPAVAF